MYLKIENVPLAVAKALMEETDFTWSKVNRLTYRGAANLAHEVTSGEHWYSPEARSVLNEIPEMWEHWGEEGFEIETFGEHGGVKFSFSD